MKTKQFFMSLLCLALILISYFSCTQSTDLNSSLIPLNDPVESPHQASSRTAFTDTRLQGTEGTFIHPQLAQTFTSNFQSANPQATKRYFFGYQKLQQLLDQKECVGLRIYSGIQSKANGQHKSNLVIYGVRTDMTDIDTGLKLEFSNPCPPACKEEEGKTFTGSEGEFISTEQAQAFTGQFQLEHPKATIGYFFGAQKLQQLLDQQGSVGIRFYSGMEEKSPGNFKSNLVLYSVLENRNDISNGLILEFGYPCPPYCGSGSERN